MFPQRKGTEIKAMRAGVVSQGTQAWGRKGGGPSLRNLSCQFHSHRSTQIPKNEQIKKMAKDLHFQPKWNSKN